VEPNPAKRKWYGVSFFHGAKERQKKDGQWVREGGQWSVPTHGHNHAFLTSNDAQAWADSQHTLARRWAEQRGLECPYRVVEMGPKPGW